MSIKENLGDYSTGKEEVDDRGFVVFDSDHCTGAIKHYLKLTGIEYEEWRANKKNLKPLKQALEESLRKYVEMGLLKPELLTDLNI